MKKLVLSALIACAVTPAMAQSTWYIVQDTTTKKCTVVDKKPTVQTTVVVGDGKVYTTKTEAETAVKTVKVCSSM